MKYLIKFRHPKPLESGIRKTYCDVGVVDDENIISEMIGISGVATCNVGDQFNYEKGRRLSLARALAPLPREIRKEIWEQYFKQKETDRIKSIMHRLFGKNVIGYGITDPQGNTTFAPLVDDQELIQAMIDKITNQEE